jgi:uncharacterized protein YcnI
VTKKLPTWIGAMTVGVIAALAIAATASAHVEVEAEGEAIAGQPAQLVFSVPNERADQATVSIEIQMPQEVDLTDVVPGDIEDWTITTTTRDGDIVDTITWDATGPGLVGEESVELPVAVGPLPAVESLTFPTVQTYDDGEVVRWIEPAPAGEPEPELPIPTLAITAATPEGTTAPTEPSTTAPTVTDPTASQATDPATPTTDAVVVATAPGDTVAATGATEVTESTTTVEADDDGGAAVWPWVVAGIIVVVVGGGAAIAFARRRTSG